MKHNVIRGSQSLLDIAPNNVAPECLRVKKVYDWVAVVSEECVVSPVPENCLSITKGVTDIEIICCPLPMQSHIANITSIKRNIPSLPENAALVTMSCTFMVRLAILDKNNDCPICCIEAPITFWVKKVVLCLPEPLGKSNIFCEVICCQAFGDIVEEELDLQLFVTLGISVETEVKLELLGKFCQPRLPIPVPSITECWSCDAPTQCSFFPS